MKLPNTWAVVKLGDFVQNEKGKKPQNESKVETPTHNLPYVDIQAFEEGVIKSWNDGVGCRLCSEADFLMVWDGSRSGLVGKGMNGALGSTLVRINFPSMLNDYAFYFLQSKYQQINTRAKGSGTPHVDPDLLWNYKFPIPPKNEQHRIVAKIEALFSELDKGIECFKTAREQLKIYRQALLKHAFSGKLTEQWRAENQGKLETAEALLQRIQTEREQRYQQQLEDWENKSPSIPLLQRGKPNRATIQTTTQPIIPPFEKGGLGGISKPKAPKTLPPLTAEELAELPELPTGWGWCRLGEFVVSIDAGKSFKCDEREPLANEIGVAKVSAVTWGEYNESESKTCMDASKVNKDYLIRSGDFILSRANTIDLVGACVIAKRVTKMIMLSDKTLRIVFDGFIQEYFLQYLRSRMGRNQIMRLSTGNQESMRNIGQERIQSIVIPFCSKTEADVVIDIVESKLSDCDQLDQTLTTALQQAEDLRQSILKKAFSGQLVSQDPSDEPASELLERIQAEKAALIALTKRK